ncbi:MAG: hypothetical protein UIH27_09130 [Ruminococcus sp.]|nr:hypothetical protein [Ruminococcus sp.]
MKKILSVILAVTLCFCMCLVPASAVNTEEGLLFKDKFYPFASWEGGNFEDVRSYDELYYHYDENNCIDWALVYGTTRYHTALEIYAVLGNRVFTQNMGDIPFVLGYGVYDAQEDTFIDLGYVYYSDRYEGLKEAIDELDIGTLIGDMNDDNDLTVKDATMIQKSLAGITDFSADDTVAEEFNNAFPNNTPQLAYKSDVNRNGARDIGDATDVQKIVAKIK